MTTVIAIHIAGKKNTLPTCINTLISNSLNINSSQSKSIAAINGCIYHNCKKNNKTSLTIKYLFRYMINLFI